MYFETHVISLSVDASNLNGAGKQITILVLGTFVTSYTLFAITKPGRRVVSRSSGDRHTIVSTAKFEYMRC